LKSTRSSKRRNLLLLNIFLSTSVALVENRGSKGNAALVDTKARRVILGRKGSRENKGCKARLGRPERPANKARKGWQARRG
jgi:hypothetical protein